MDKSDENDQYDVQKIAEKKYITEKAASKKAVIIFITAFLIVGMSIIGIVYYLLSTKLISSDLGKALGTVKVEIEDKSQIETDINNVFVNNVHLYYEEEEEEVDLYPFVNGEGLYGYIDSNGEVIIEAQYGYANFFSEGIAFVVIGEKGAYISEKGEVITSGDYFYGDSFCNGLAVVYYYDIKCNEEDDEISAVINKDGKEVLIGKYDYVTTEYNGFIVTEKDNKETLYDVNGNEISISDKYSIYRGFCEGYAVIEDNESYDYYILNEDLKIINFDEYNITDISTSFYELYNEDKGKYVYLNSKLEPIYLKDDYSYLTCCFDNENEIACVYYYGSNERVYTYIDYCGNKLFDSKYEIDSSFVDGIAPAYLVNEDNYSYGIVDSKGNLIESGFYYVEVANKNRLIVYDENYTNVGVRDLEGNWIIDDEYDSITAFNNLFICKTIDGDNESYDAYTINGNKINDESFGSSFFSYSKMIYIYDINRDDYKNDYYINTENYDVIQFQIKNK
ncbi:WG repeat-containing protein [Clostridium sp. 1001271B_151109_B4]|uniref:WG repeat-containing protein n=1 Tax=Clostridium sp. 1001271B_151109_B4 TaxID=2787148 RepID=UPI0018A899FA|nr:WG repeat-containing protein [Clostridium sp. 1001271B_151109_B4]